MAKPVFVEPKARDIRIEIHVGDAHLGGYLIEDVPPDEVKAELVGAMRQWADDIEAMA